MIDFGLCIETAFVDQRSFADRVRAAADAGFAAVEIWDWRGKPLRDLDLALHQTKMHLHTICVEDWRDKCHLGDRSAHIAFLERVVETARVAIELGVPKLVILAGDVQQGTQIDSQFVALGDVLARASDAIATQPVELVLEVVNRQFEGPNALLRDSQSAIRLLRGLGRPNVRLLYDRYHAILNGEPLGWAIEGNMDLIGHVQAADVPGRHEFGTGMQDWVKEFAWLLGAGYRGYVGIEAVLAGRADVALHHAQSLLRQSTSSVAVGE